MSKPELFHAVFTVLVSVAIFRSPTDPLVVTACGIGAGFVIIALADRLARRRP